MTHRFAFALGLAIGPFCFIGVAEGMPALRGSAATEFLKKEGVYRSLGEAIDAAMYGAHPDELGFAAANPRHDFVARFSKAGLEIDGRDWKSSWRLRSVGYGERQVAVSPARLEANGNRVELRRGGGVTEWYRNGARGLEQGFTLQRPSLERHAGDRLRLTIQVAGDLKGRMRSGADDAGIELVGFDGTVALRYEHLVVTDANGRKLAARIQVVKDAVWLEVEDAGAAWPVTVDPTFVQQGILKASVPGTNDLFGYSVAVAGDTVVVGAYYEDSNATGVNGDQSNNGALDSGAAYVFVRSGATWTQQAYLKASNTEADDWFGWAVAVSGDAAVVGAIHERSNATGVNGNQNNNSADGSGAAYVFVRNGVIWTQQAYLKASNTDAGTAFGWSVAVSGDTVLAGAPFENSNATGVNGNQNSHDAGGSGAAYVFVRNGVIWTQQAYLKASNTGENDEFGTSVAVSGDTVVVGAYQERSDASGVNGNQNNDDNGGSGAAYVFVRNGVTWTQQAYLKASNSGVDAAFGCSVDVSGDTVVVGAYGESSNATGVNGTPNGNNNIAVSSGAAYVFVRSGTTWSQQAYLKASNAGEGDEFGTVVAVSGGTVAVGAYLEDSSATGVNGQQANESAINSGAVYVFTRNGVTWSQQDYLKASATGVEDQFGVAVAVSGDTVVAGAYQPEGAVAPAAGAAYAFYDGPACSYTLSASNQSLGATGGSGTVGVTAPVGCAWTAVSHSIFLTVTSGSSGSGNGTVNFSVGANGDAAPRNGTITMAGQTFTVAQAGAGTCTYTLSQASQNVAASGAAASVGVTAPVGCAWTAISNAIFVTVTSGSNGSGLGTVNFSVGANGGGAARNGTLTIAGQTFTVNQSGAVIITDIRSITDFGDVPNFTSGSWLQIKGSNLADTTRIWQGSDFNGNNAPVNLDNVSVVFNGRLGFVSFTKPDDQFGPSQINVQAPGDLGDGPVNVQVLNRFAVSNTFTIQKTALAPGMLAPPKFNVGGKQYLAATYSADYFFVGNENLAAGAPFRPAKPGDSIWTYGIGFGDVAQNIPPGVIPTGATQLNAQVQFQFGPAPVTPNYAGLYPGFIGLDLFVLTVPDVPDGDHQITVLVNGQPLAQTLYLTVKR